jgi:hypothetical protein
VPSELDFPDTRLCHSVSGTNLARACGNDQQQACPVTQSTTFQSHVAALANDGSRTGGYSHTDGRSGVCGPGFDLLPWWMVDLGSQRMIGGGTIWHGDKCCPGRLNGLQIWAGNGSAAYNAPGNVKCYTAVTTEHYVFPFTHTFTCPVLGQYLYVIIPGGECLSMCEVEIYSLGENPNFANSYLMNAVGMLIGEQPAITRNTKSQLIIFHAHRCLSTMSTWIILCTLWYEPRGAVTWINAC